MTSTTYAFHEMHIEKFLNSIESICPVCPNYQEVFELTFHDNLKGMYKILDYNPVLFSFYLSNLLYKYLDNFIYEVKFDETVVINNIRYSFL